MVFNMVHSAESICEGFDHPEAPPTDLAAAAVQLKAATAQSMQQMLAANPSGSSKKKGGGTKQQRKISAETSASDSSSSSTSSGTTPAASRRVGDFDDNSSDVSNTRSRGSYGSSLSEIGLSRSGGDVRVGEAGGAKEATEGKGPLVPDGGEVAGEAAARAKTSWVQRLLNLHDGM